MRYILTLLCLIGIAYGQSTVYLRADSIKIMKQNGNANLQILNATRDTTNGVLMNIGNGVTAFIRIVQISSTQFTVGTDTITMEGGGGGSDSTALLRNPTISGYAILDFSSYVDTVYGKRLVPGYGLLFDSTATTITPRVDTATLGVIVRGYGWNVGGNTLAADGRLGTNSNHDIHIYTNNVKRAEFTNAGQYLWNASSSPLGYNHYINDTSHVTAIRILGSGTMMSGIGSNALFGIKGSSASSTDYNMLITDNGNVQLLRISNTGIIIGTFGTLTSTAWTVGGVTAIIKPTNATTTTGNLISLSHTNVSAQTSGNVNMVHTFGNFTPASGAGTFVGLAVKPIIAQTGSASGKSYGIKINPSLTNAVEWTPFMITTETTNWPEYSIQQARITTTNATPTTLHTFTTVGVAVDISSTYLFKCEIIANRTGGAAGAAGDNAVYIYEGAFERINGVVTLMTESLRLVSENQAGWNVTSNISSTSVQLLVTGATNNDVTWHMVKGEISHGGE